MDIQHNSLLGWACYCHGKQTMEDLRHSLLYTTLELEQTKIVAQEELKKRDGELMEVKDLLSRTIKERDEALERCHKLMYEKLLLEQQQHQKQQAPPLSGVSSVEDDQQQQPKFGIDSNNGFSSSDCEESIVSPQIAPDPANQIKQQAQLDETRIEFVVPERPLPEKGKLLQAVLKAGPLLQTLLLAGPLPQWRHPPPPLESFEIPLVTIPPPPPPQQLPSPTQDSLVNTTSSGNIIKKRILSDGSPSPTETKYQRIVLY